ncbi:MAG: DinB family protein [Chitinophagaceae bacterium]|nr:DinB family protein [Chitinophagaceae bacterium]
MKPVNKYLLLEDLEARVESHLADAVKIFQNLPEAALLKPSATGGWSIAQCLDHLNRYGHYYLPQIKKGLEQKTPENDTFKSTWLGSYFTRMMEPSTGTKKIKAFRAYVPPAQLNAHAVVAAFITQQETLLTYLKNARSSNLNIIRVPVSIARFIRLKLGDVFGFIIAHNERHIQQAKRNI